MARLNVADRRQSTMLMDAALRFGELRGDADATVAGTLLAAGCFAAVLRWIAAEPEPFDLPEQLDPILDLVLRGLLT